MGRLGYMEYYAPDAEVVIKLAQFDTRRVTTHLNVLSTHFSSLVDSPASAEVHARNAALHAKYGYGWFRAI